MKRALSVLLLLAVVFCLFSCSDGASGEETEAAPDTVTGTEAETTDLTEVETDDGTADLVAGILSAKNWIEYRSDVVRVVLGFTEDGTFCGTYYKGEDQKDRVSGKYYVSKSDKGDTLVFCQSAHPNGNNLNISKVFYVLTDGFDVTAGPDENAKLLEEYREKYPGEVDGFKFDSLLRVSDGELLMYGPSGTDVYFSEEKEIDLPTGIEGVWIGYKGDYYIFGDGGAGTYRKAESEDIAYTANGDGTVTVTRDVSDPGEDEVYELKGGMLVSVNHGEVFIKK